MIIPNRTHARSSLSNSQLKCMKTKDFTTQRYAMKHVLHMCNGIIVYNPTSSSRCHTNDAWTQRVRAMRAPVALCTRTDQNKETLHKRDGAVNACNEISTLS